MANLRHRSYLAVRLLLSVNALAMLGLASAIAQLAPPGQGVIRALIIGADHYDSPKHPTLKGAVADARDLDQVLRKGGATDVTLLIDEKASRREAQAAFDQLVASARTGDLVIISFAGHGSRAPERVKGSNPDGYDEVFVLPGFDDKGPANAERILDKEINVWLTRLEQKGAYTLFIADTCHGGGLIRNVDMRAGEASYRQTTISIEPYDDAVPITRAVDRLHEPEEFDRVTFLAAADKRSKSPELRIPGQPTLRGALSYAVARALEGAADQNKDGRTTRRELFEYAQQVVQQYSHSRQKIVAEPRRRTDLIDGVVFREAGARETTLPPSPEARINATVRVAILNGPAARLAGVQPHAAKFEIVGRNQNPDIVWDVASGDIVSAVGDVEARDIKPADMADIIDRVAAVAAIAKLSEERPQNIMLRPNDKHHREHEIVWFRAEDVQGKSIVLFNIATDGKIQFLFPENKDKASSDDASFELRDIRVQPPFGADHVVAIVSDQRLAKLEEAITAFNGKRAAGRIPGILRAHLAGQPSARIGFAGLFTVP